ncbi:MAG: substrate-binding domain-containing protein [Anaerolineales bacterium]|nr:substrate-binding domain-containing protein [Anaerolineae bacterium]MCB9142406.1 substrate-binding domain-containing protein [Anaerolineales bacterium]MCO5245774.1 substrate-binding domain-containing protein [Anaerolineae bacterium]
MSCHRSIQATLHRPMALVIALLFANVAGACGTAVATPVPVSLTLAASSSAQPVAALLSDGYMERNPHITITIQPVGSELAAQRYVEQGRADAALLVATPPVAFSEGLTGTLIATDALVLVVNPENPLDNIGFEQARSVFTGRTRLWSELDAGSGAIQVVTRESGVGVRNALQQAVMGRRRFTPTALVYPGNRELREAIATEPLAVGFLPASWLDDQVKPLTLEGMSHEWVALNVPGYPMVLPIYLVTDGDSDPDVVAFQEFILGEAGAALMGGRYGLPQKGTS